MIVKKEKAESASSLGLIKDFPFVDDGGDAVSGPKYVFSSDSLSGYGLDLVFELVKEAGFDGLDLALWKNFDAWNVEYVQKLSQTHQLPVAIVQVSSSVNQKEMTKALDMCEALGTTTITINAPTMFNYKSYSYLCDVLPRLREEYPHIRFSLINPEDASLFALPIPQYRFSNIAEIVKKQHCYLALDVANMDSTTLENDMMRKIKDFLPYLSTVYVSDKSRTGVSHLLPGEGVLKL